MLRNAEEEDSSKNAYGLVTVLQAKQVPMQGRVGSMCGPQDCSNAQEEARRPIPAEP